jgi:2'-5' RNA ligase
MTDEKRIRAFLAIDPPEEVLREIDSLQGRLRTLISGDIRWVRPEGIHLTLKFFGDVTGADAETIAAVTREVALVEKPFSLVVGGAGVFPDPRRPRVLWLGMSGDLERLLLFQTRLDQALRLIGFPREERPFRPHLTLARIKDSRSLAGLGRALEKGEQYQAGRFAAAGLSLMQSELKTGGAVYKQLQWFPFEGRTG